VPTYQLDAEPARTGPTGVSPDARVSVVESGRWGEIAAGATVVHDAFGTGRVVESRGSGRDRKLLIDFPGVGLKTVLARFVVPGA
jgi:hypothetical protein